MNTTPDENDAPVTAPQSQVTIHAQYLKDLSFENPNAPVSLIGPNIPPEVDINIAVDTKRLDHDKIENFFEVVLTIEINAARESQLLFLTELKYGAAVSIQDIKSKPHMPILFVEVPRMLFPFVRMIISEATANGGFTPLQLSMVDFRAMYLQKFGQKADKNNQENSD